MLCRSLLMVALLAPQFLGAQFHPDDYSKPALAVINLSDGYQNINPFASSDRLFFTKISHPSNTGNRDDHDVWTSAHVNGSWTEPTNSLPGINTEQNDLVVGTSPTGLVYVMQYRQGHDEQLHQIIAYNLVGNSYSAHHTIELPSVQFHSEFFGFFIAPDESFVLASMKGEYSFGKEDLYVYLKKGQTYSDPIHLGARVNTAGFEMSPWMASDGRHLFFASEGHNSLGSSDIYVTYRSDDTWQNWTKPMNLGPKVNSPFFEAYFSLAEGKQLAVFVSNKQGKAGQLFECGYGKGESLAHMSHSAASGFLRLEKLPAMNVKLNLMDENDNVVQSITTNEEGFFSLQSFLPDRDYKIAIDESAKADLSDADIFLTNNLGDQMIFMNDERLGMFGFKVMSGQQVNGVNELEQLASDGAVVDKPATISGRVNSFGTLDERVTLNVVDHENKVVETITTDDQGYFSFSTKASERSYFLSIEKDQPGLVDVYEIFLTNQNEGEDIVVTKTDKHLFEFRTLHEGNTRSLARMPETDMSDPKAVLDKYGFAPAASGNELTGYIKHGKLPLMNAEIMLLDENDRPLDSAITDAEGKFVFNDQLKEGSYSLKMDEEQQAALDESEIYLVKNPSDVVMYLNDSRAGVFAFKKLAKRDPTTLYSLRTEVERGAVVTEVEASLRGKFAYTKLPKDGVTLNLIDDQENVIQTTETDAEGNFEFDRYAVNQNYFISVEGSGLSDIYEIFLSGQQKNVLVNRTNKYVFAFKVLPTQDVVLSEAFELGEASPATEFGATLVGDKHAYYEFDLNVLAASQFISLQRIVAQVHEGFTITLRLSKELASPEGTKLETIDPASAEALSQALTNWGIEKEQIIAKNNGSDQLLIQIKP